VVAIRALADRGVRQRDIAERFRVSVMTVSRIKNRRTWQHVTE
jgi:hypothetical protein